MREKHKFLKKNMGFTLTELIVTMAVSALLLSAAAAGIVAWVRHADFVRNESYAETIYYAAQSELTRYRGNGQLAELAEYVKADEEGSEYRVPVEKIDPTIAEKYKNRLYYLKKDAGTVDENNPLGKWLSDYIYDGSIMEGAICVEFDPMDGTVYSVSYSDKNNSFTYAEETEATADKEASLLARAENIRKEKCVGYYSVELSEAAPSAVKKTRLDRVRLVNEEQLYLRWSLPERYSSIRGFLSYTIEIYEEAQTAGEKDELRYTFTVKGSKLKEKRSENSITQDAESIGNYTVTCTDASGKEFDLIAYMDENGEMYLVLDSIDYGVDPADITVSADPANQPFNTDAFRNSASVLQLFAEPEDIYVKVQASGKSFRGSAKKQSNTSNTMFASMNETEDDCTYEIKNARHLYNIRYREREKELGLLADIEKLYYQQTADIVWLSDDEKLFHSDSVGPVTPGMKMNPLRDEDKCIPAGETAEGEAAAVPYFPAIPSLSTFSTLEVRGNRDYELKNFVLYQKKPGEPEEPAADETGEPEAFAIDETADETEEPTEGATETGKLGLIAENRGTIRKLTVTDITVQGYENVGAVCGVNTGEGKVRNTTVSGKVTGVESVGGLVGLDKTNSVIPSEKKWTDLSEEDLKNSQYQNLINYAKVSGDGGKIGGIVGALGEKGQAYLCENYGAVKAAETCAVYIGGISGYNKGLVQSCLSAPDDAPEKYADGTTYELKGIFVGGVVGCNNGGAIINSGTEKESKNLAGERSDSHIIGYRYVGGIVGYNNGTPEGEGRTTVGTLVNTDSGKTNKANVIGHDYVGGIVGANGTLEDVVTIDDNIKNLTDEDKKAFEECEIKEEYSDKILVKGWTNEGFVEAVKVKSKNSDVRYAGGIAGYNAGDLLDCTTRINTSSGTRELIAQVRQYGEDASYVGGVTGYNVGYIYTENTENSEKVSVNSVVSGKKYVGGIVGYNGEAAEISDSVPEDKKGNSGKIVDYALSGGYIFGKAYVGGYAGLNTTENLLGNNDSNILFANPNEVTADYFAGGVMGALILAPKNSNKEITVRCNANSFFGSIKAEKAFAGGYVGYTQLLDTGKDAEDRAKALYGKVEGKSTQELVKTVLDERLESGLDNTAYSFKFVSGGSCFDSVEAPVFAGGVIGGNGWNTNLLLENITNQVLVTGTDSVTYDFISIEKNTKDDPEKKEKKQDRFSFAGGIIGLVTPNAVIDKCKNSNAGGVVGKGTYSGGIAEVNLGTISNCTVGSASGVNYYGGIAGLNTNDGIIKDCDLNGQISGESYLGGIVVCNESIITGCTVQSTMESESAVIGTGKYIGGIAAVSRKKVEEVKEDGEKTYYLNMMTSCQVSSNIGAENLGEAVGGLIGRYEGGTLKSCDVSGNTIYGLDRVGGIVGEICEALKVEIADNKKVSNLSEVHAVGAAGGIGGYLKEGASVTRCQNRGYVRSTGGLAGGIVPEIGIGSSVSDCENYGSVEAVREMAGGVAAKNSGIIEGCIMSSESAGKEAEITGVKAIGGIAGENWGNIKTCTIKGAVTVRDINASGTDWVIGGIAGRNTGTISDSTAEVVSDKRPMVTTSSNGSYLGGIAGTNLPDGTGTGIGKIENCTVNLDVSLSTGQSGTIGGAAGANGGVVSNVTFSGGVSGTAGSQYGTGGIAGRNEFGGKAGSISGCKLSGGTVSAVSNDTGFKGHNDSVKGVYVGGICGVNPEGGSITGCSLAGESKVSGDYGYVGGVAAYNLGILSRNKSEESDAAPKIYNINHNTNKCVMGGIAAYNGVSGIVEDCSTGKWTIDNEMNGDTLETYPTGGIIGSNKSIHDQKNLVNYANVRGNWMTGGIIGQQFTAQRGGFTIEKCTNYGNITGTVRCAGGIISDWRNRGGRVRECLNYGEIRIVKSDQSGRNAAGGIIGTSYSGTAIAITVERCGNEGNVSHAEYPYIDEKGVNQGLQGRAGGIFGVYNCDIGTLNLTITDCYNAALIQNAGANNNAVSAGIFAGDENGGKGEVNIKILRCVNYGMGTDKNKPFAGIVSKKLSTGSKSVGLCLNVGECYDGQKPIAYNMPDHGTEDGGNYYFSNPTEVNFDYTAAARGSQAAKLKDSDGSAFIANNNTRFDEGTNRLYLGSEGRYIQFKNVSGTYSPGGDKTQIKKLKENFSSGRKDEYALIVFGMESGAFMAPSSVKLEETDGTYKVTYVGHPDAIFCTAGYELEILGRKDGSDWAPIGEKISLDSSQNTWTITRDDLLGKNNPEQYTELKAQVRAVKVKEGYDDITTSNTTEDGNGCSAWTASDPLTTTPKLPTPQVHFEVTDKASLESNQMSGYWVLDNAEDYGDYGKNWKIVVKFDGGTLADEYGIAGGSVRAKTEGSYRKDGGQNDNINRPVEAYAEPVNGSHYARSDTYTDSLRWYSRGSTLKAEHVTSDNGGEFIGTKAGELSYRFLMRQDAGNYKFVNITCMAELYLGNQKLGDGTVELPNQQGEAYCTIDLSSLNQDTVRRLMESVAGDGSGEKVKVCFYPWEVGNVKYYETEYDKETGTTKIVSRTIPEAYKKDEHAFNSSYQQFTLSGMTGYQMLPAPKAGDNIITDIADDGTIKYTLYWDANVGNDGTIKPLSGSDYAGAEYVVTVTGKADDGTEVTLHQETIKVGDSKLPAVTLTENNWKYNQLVLHVERLGKAPASGTSGTHYIGESSEKAYKIPIRLSSVPKPNAKLRDGDTVVFVVDWVKSAESGAVGYRIIITGKDKDGKPVRFTVDVDGVENIKKEIDLDEAAYSTLDQGEDVEFSVVVRSASDDAGHVESRESQKVTCKIPERLKTPEKMPNLKLSDTTPVNKDTPLPTEKFEQMILHLENSGASLEDAGYRIEYFVAGANAVELGGLSADWEQNGGERPKQDSVKGIYISEEPDAMNGNLREATYALNRLNSPFNADQAGRILWYRVREVSNSKISSPWTTWHKIELPKAVLAPVTIAEGQTADRECAYTVNGVAKAEYVVTMRQPKLDFAPVPFAKGYAIDIREANSTEDVTESDGSTTKKIIPGDLHSYTLEKATSPEGAESLVLKAGNAEIKVESEETSATGEKIRTFKPLYTIEHSQKIGDATYGFQMSARICYSIKNGIIQEIWLELPDGVALDGNGDTINGDNPFIGTAAADITVIPPDPDRYAVEELTRWQRDEEDPKKITITEVEKASASIAVMGYFEDELNIDQLSEQALQLFGLSRPPEKLLPEEETQEAETPEEELPEEEMQEAEPLKEEPPEEADKEEEDSEKSEASGNNVPDSDAEQ